MSELGAIGSYTLAIEQLQLSLIKQSAEADRQIVETLMDSTRMVQPSAEKGTQVDKSI